MKKKKKRKTHATEVVSVPVVPRGDPPFGFSPLPSPYKPGDPLHAIDSESARFARFRLCRGRRSCWTRWNIARNLNKFTASARTLSLLRLGLVFGLNWQRGHAWERSLKLLHTAVSLIRRIVQQVLHNASHVQVLSAICIFLLNENITSYNFTIEQKHLFRFARSNSSSY